jgi:PBP1b-binding outer membrane lipoprotein LpoB
VDNITYDDFSEAAEILVQSMLQSGTLDASGLSHTPDGKVVLALENIDNYTSSTSLKSKVLTDKFRIALNKTGKVATTTAVRFGGKEVEDSGTREARGLSDSEMFEQRDYGKAITPDISLSGSIITMSTEEGRTKESVAIFKLTVTDLRTGLAVWEDEAPIGKRRTRGLIGG